MPGTKKPSRKPASRQTVKRVPAAPLPDIEAMDAYVRQTSIGHRRAAVQDAQALIYDAWEQSTARARATWARKALAVSPLCADAFNILAEGAATHAQARDLYALGVAAGERDLGPTGFEEYADHFWGFLETRPYMRARAGLATSLLALGEEEAALEHFRAMLVLNPGDNQGIRYIVLACLLERDDVAGLRALLADYPDEYSTHWLYTTALLAFRDNKGSEPATHALLGDAWSCNAHVPDILAGTRKLKLSTNGYMTVGGPDEASEYVSECGDAWRRTPGAIEWLLASRPAAKRS